MNNIGFGLSNGVYAERFDDGEIYVANTTKLLRFKFRLDSHKLSQEFS